MLSPSPYSNMPNSSTLVCPYPIAVTRRSPQARILMARHIRPHGRYLHEIGRPTGSTFYLEPRLIFRIVRPRQVNLTRRCRRRSQTAGAVGIVTGDACVVALAVFEYAELPSTLICTYTIAVNRRSSKAGILIRRHIRPRGRYLPRRGRPAGSPLYLEPRLIFRIVRPRQINLTRRCRRRCQTARRIRNRHNATAADSPYLSSPITSRADPPAPEQYIVEAVRPVF